MGSEPANFAAIAIRRPPVITYLLGVVLVPLIALASVLVVQVQALGSTNREARRFQAEVTAGASWVELRAAVQDERLFVEALATSQDLGVPVNVVALLTGVDFEAQAALAQLRTDEALASVDVAGLTGELSALERARSNGASRDEVRAAFSALENNASEQVTARQAAVRAASADLPLAQGVHSDLDAFWGFEDYSSLIRQQLAALFAFLSATTPEEQQAARDRLVVAEAEAHDIRAQLTITAPSWAGPLDDLESRPAVGLIEQQIADSLDARSGERIDLDDLHRLGQLFLAFEDRHDAIEELFTRAGIAVRAEANRIGDDAARSRRQWALIGSTVLVGSVALATVAATMIRSPLRRLERVARDLGHGRLDATVDVRRGPREVGVVGAALNQAIASLRAVADRAEQLIAGQPVTEAQASGIAAGPLGDAIEATLATLERSWRQQAELRAQLAHAATHDALTGLANRTALSQHLQGRIANETEPEHGFAIMFIDLDGFKEVNDQFGHAAGDAVLVDVANRLRQVSRAPNLVARIGGDEFVVVTAQLTDSATISDLAERILAGLGQPYDVANTEVLVGASIGVATSEGTLDADELLGRADEALYLAKARGRSCIQYEVNRTTPQDPPTGHPRRPLRYPAATGSAVMTT